MYKNLLKVMKYKGITAIQIANLLECRQATISEKLNGLVARGFYFDEAAKIRKVFFPEYDYDYLFERDEKAA
jgi:predicted transcriptional regulator